MGRDSMVDSILNEVTGEMSGLADYVGRLRTLERAIDRLDNAFASLKIDVKMTKQARDKAIGELRAAVREAKVMAEKAKRAKARE